MQVCDTPRVVTVSMDKCEFIQTPASCERIWVWKENGDLIGELPVEAIGEDEIQRPQPADEPISVVDSQDLYRVMRHTIGRLTAQGRKHALFDGHRTLDRVRPH